MGPLPFGNFWFVLSWNKIRNLRFKTIQNTTLNIIYDVQGWGPLERLRKGPQPRKNVYPLAGL